MSAVRSWSPEAKSRAFLSLSLARDRQLFSRLGPGDRRKVEFRGRGGTLTNHGEPTAADFSPGPRAHLVVKIKRKSPGRPQTFQRLAQLGEGSKCLTLSTCIADGLNAASRPRTDLT